MSIANVTDCKYLGITISVKNCDLDLKRQRRRFFANTNMLFTQTVGLYIHSYISASGMPVNLNIPSFGELLRKYVYNFRNRLETSDNDIICDIYLSHFLIQSGISALWYDILSP